MRQGQVRRRRVRRRAQRADQRQQRGGGLQRARQRQRRQPHVQVARRVRLRLLLVHVTHSHIHADDTLQSLQTLYAWEPSWPHSEVLVSELIEEGFFKSNAQSSTLRCRYLLQRTDCY